MANSQLENKIFVVPNSILQHIKNTLDSWVGNKQRMGYVHLRNIYDKQKLSYDDMKNIVKRFGYLKKNTPTYEDFGGFVLDTWVNTTLDKERKILDTIQKNKTKLNLKSIKGK